MAAYDRYAIEELHKVADEKGLWAEKTDDAAEQGQLRTLREELDAAWSPHLFLWKKSKDDLLKEVDSVVRMGAELVLTSAKDGMQGAVARAQELVDSLPDAWMPQQFDNPANPGIHETTTGPEIWADTAGNVDIFVAGVGTGGTLTGVTRFLRRRKPELQAIAVEPAESAIISGGSAGSHKIQGIGAGFLPKNLDTSLLAGVETVTSDEAFHWARRLAREEGILAGISSGANVAAAARLAARPENRGKTIVTIAASSGERYLSTPLYQLNGKHVTEVSVSRSPVAAPEPAEQVPAVQV